MFMWVAAWFPPGREQDTEGIREELLWIQGMGGKGFKNNPRGQFIYCCHAAKLGKYFFKFHWEELRQVEVLVKQKTENKGKKREMKKGKTGGGEHLPHCINNWNRNTKRNACGLHTGATTAGHRKRSIRGFRWILSGSTLRRCYADQPVKSDWVSMNRSHRRSSFHRAPLSILRAWRGLKRARLPAGWREDEVISRELRGEQVEETLAWMRQWSTRGEYGPSSPPFTITGAISSGFLGSRSYF